MESEDVIRFCQSDLPRTSFAAFEDMRKRGELCDITIKVQNYSFTAHRVILAAGIPYFRSVFTSGDVENKQKEMSLGNLDPSALASLIDFAYNSKVNISIENARSLLQASIFFQVDQVHDACVEFLSRRLHATNVVGVWRFAQTLNDCSLIESSNKYILENFEEVSKSDDFLSLPYLCVKEIILEDDLNVWNEEIVFEAVVNWVKSSPAERHGVLPELLNEVRMVQLPTDYLIDRVDSEKLVRTSIPCRDLVNEIKNYHLSKKKSVLSDFNTRPRKFQSMKVDVYAVCFNVNNSECSVYCGDFVDETWRNISSKILNCVTCLSWNAAAVNEKVYIFFKETIQTFHVKTVQWEELKERHRAIHFSSILPYRNIIYCFGSDDDSLSDKIRYFDTVKDNWLEPGVMKIARWGAASATVGEFIYVTGGRSGGRYLSSVEKYNPATGKSIEVAPMLTARRSHGCVAMNGKIYICGGWTTTDDNRSCTAEVFDPLTHLWTYISSMNIRRSSLSLVSHDRKIYAFGGCARNDYHTLEGEIYNPERDQWRSCFSAPCEFDRAVSIPAAIRK